MAAEIQLSRLLRQLPELRDALSENRRIILISAAAVVGYYILVDPAKDALHGFSAYIYHNYLLKDRGLREYREQMKADLALQKAQDPRTHNDDTLRILEIGMGRGTNLEFYPKSSRVIAVESNPYFVNKLLKLQKSYPILVKVIRGFAEDLREIANESVDAVVSTMVLCSVKDLDKSIKEVKRVLVKGGKFYFFEHEACQSSWKRYLLQIVMTPVWRVFFDGCHLCRQIYCQIEANGFEMSHTKQSIGHLTYIIRSQTEGYAIKP